MKLNKASFQYMFALLFSVATLFAQNITGTVSGDDGSALAGANVAVEGTDSGASSNPIQRGIKTLRVALSNVGLVHLGGTDIGQRGVLIPPHPEINVTGHMHEMTRPRHQVGQTIRGGFSLRRIGRGL